MANIAIAGAGIAGPAAALSLINAGHDVTVYESRKPEDVESSGVIGITEANCSLLRPLGADLESIALDNLYHEWMDGGMKIHRFTTEKFVVWSQVHQLLTDAAVKAGAEFNWDTPAPDKGIVVQASGLRHARSRGLQPTPRYLVYRGLSTVPTDFAWLSLNDPQKRFSFKLASTPVGAAWELYVHRDSFPLASQDADGLPPECALLPEEFQVITNNSVTLATSAISDWEVADRLRHESANSLTLTIGDANGGQRPHTGMGANLAIGEALALPALLHPTPQTAVLERELLAARHKQHERGIQMGQMVMGK
jgi:2-polyprenyl-6-methoxyphenol hydroxylase-like FAD-dependent oxidoreductase